MDSTTFLQPSIDAAVMTPNPVSINQMLRLAITVSEIEIILQPVYYYAGEIYAGEA